MGPFDASIGSPLRRSVFGAVVLYTVSSENGHVSAATALRVRFAGN